MHVPKSLQGKIMLPDQHSGAVDPVAQKIQAHRIASAAYIATYERSWRLTEAIDPDLDFEDLDDVRTKVCERYGEAAPAKFNELMAAREATRLAGEEEDAAASRFEAVPIETAAQAVAYVSYAKEHAASCEDGSELVFLLRALDRVASTLVEHMAG